MGLRNFLVESLPIAAMVLMECLDVGMTTLSKAAMTRGMSHFVFVVYSNALAALILLPSSFFITRNKRPPLSFSLLSKFFVLSLIGITVMQNCVFTGINYSSPTLGSAASNLIPAFTFVLAVIFRMEKLDITNSRSQIKVVGTVVSISGALLVTLYKGAPIGGLQSQNLSAESGNWIIGGFFLATASLCYAVWTIAQAQILKGYPSELTIVTFYCLFGAIQCVILSLFVVRDPNVWRLRLDIELISIFYSAIFGSVLTFSVLTWCIHKKGPVFVAMFKPLGIAIAALMGVIFLGDTLHVGSVIGAVIIVIGFYAVLWAQSKDEENGKSHKVDRLPSSSSPSSPLLRNHHNQTNVLA